MKKYVFFLFLVFLCVFALSWVASDNTVEITRCNV